MIRGSIIRLPCLICLDKVLETVRVIQDVTVTNVELKAVLFIRICSEPSVRVTRAAVAPSCHGSEPCWCRCEAPEEQEVSFRQVAFLWVTSEPSHHGSLAGKRLQPKYLQIRTGNLSSDESPGWDLDRSNVLYLIKY